MPSGKTGWKNVQKKNTQPKVGSAGLEGEVKSVFWTQMDVSKNRGTPKWMVYNGKPY